MKKNKLIVFDIDGTLTDSVSIHQRLFVLALKQIGVDEVPVSLNNFKHHTDSYIAKEIYENVTGKVFNVEELIDFENFLFEELKKEVINEIKGAKKLIKYLETSTDFGICFATGSLLKLAKFKLQSIDIVCEGSQLTASDNICYSRERIVRKAISKAERYYNVSKFKKVISVGDGIWDLKTAKELGVDFVGVGEKNKKELLDVGAKYCYKNCTSFLNNLRENKIIFDYK